MGGHCVVLFVQRIVSIVRVEPHGRTDDLTARGVHRRSGPVEDGRRDDGHGGHTRRGYGIATRGNRANDCPDGRAHRVAHLVHGGRGRGIGRRASHTSRGYVRRGRSPVRRIDHIGPWRFPGLSLGGLDSHRLADERRSAGTIESRHVDESDVGGRHSTAVRVYRSPVHSILAVRRRRHRHFVLRDGVHGVDGGRQLVDGAVASIAREMAAPDWLAWVVIVAAAAGLLDDMAVANDVVRGLSWNTLIGLSAVYWAVGIGVLFYILRAIQAHALAYACILAMMLLLPHLHVALCAVGLFDTWANFRQRADAAIEALREGEEQEDDEW